MAVSFDEDDWERVKLGRFSDADERLVKRIMGARFVRSRRSKRPSSPKGISKHPKTRERQLQALMSRGNMVALGLNYTPRKQAVVRVRFCPKSRRGVKRQVLYVTRRRSQDLRNAQYKALPVWNGFGVPIEDGDIASLTENWDLPSDEDNMSKKARTALAEGDLEAFNALGGRERLRNVLTWHFILSIEEGDEALFECFRAAVRLTVDKAFTTEGHASLWAIHSDTKHLHAHVIVKALSDFGGRLHSDIRGDYLHYLREAFAGSLRRVGLEYEATRRVDRRALREDILAGRAPLREKQRPWRDGDGLGDVYAKLPRWPQVYGQTAIESLRRMEVIRRTVKEAIHALGGPDKATHAAELLREHLDQLPAQSSWRSLFRPHRKKKSDNDNLSKPEWELLQLFGHMFHDPRQALESWRLMASDGGYQDKQGRKVYRNRALAILTIQKHPEHLGSVKSGAYQIDDYKRLKDLLKKVRLWAPEHLPRMEHNDNTYNETIWRMQAEKDRAGVLANLADLQARIENAFPGHRLSRAVGDAIHQAGRIQIDKPPANLNKPQGQTTHNTGVRQKGVQVPGPDSEEQQNQPIKNEPTGTPITKSLKPQRGRGKKSDGLER